MKNIVVLFITITVLVGCDFQSSKYIPKQSEDDTILINPMFKIYIDSFLNTANDYNKITNIVCFIKIEKSINNSVFKIRFEMLYDKSMYLKINYNYSFYCRKILCLVDFGLSNLLKKKKLKDFNVNFNRSVPKDINFPVWLILIKENKIVKINKNASSFFGPLQNFVGVFTKEGIEYYYVNDWGEKLEKIDSTKTK